MSKKLSEEHRKMVVKARNERGKTKVKERIRLSNEAEKMGLAPDPWVVEYRAKRRAETKIWIEKTGYKEPTRPGRKKKPKPRKQRILKTKEEKIEYKRQWERNNRERLNEMRRTKRQTDIGFKMACNLRKRLSFLLRLHMAKKTKQTLSLLGCDMPFFMGHLAGKFQHGMSFDNYGEWHLDHMLPCDSFDLTDPEQQAKCFHYTNIQPLWGLDNRAKSNKMPFEYSNN